MEKIVLADNTEETFIVTENTRKIIRTLTYYPKITIKIDEKKINEKNYSIYFILSHPDFSANLLFLSPLRQTNSFHRNELDCISP
jgi:hypothetical protein